MGVKLNFLLKKNETVGVWKQGAENIWNWERGRRGGPGRIT
jgi:hypothetical protein